MTASDLVAGDLDPRQTPLEPSQLDDQRIGGGEGRADDLGGAAGPQRGRNHRIGDRQHLAAGRRVGRRADRAGLRLDGRHRDPCHRCRRPRRQPRTGFAGGPDAARQGRGAVALARGHQRRHRGVRRLRPDQPAPDVRAVAGRPAAHRRRHPPGQELLPTAAQCQRRGAAARVPPGAGGSPSWWHGRCWRRCVRSWAACCSRSAASTRPPGNC